MTMPKMWRAGDVGRGGKGHSEGLIGAYWEILEGHRRAAARAILFTVASGLLETAAILSVVPIIEPQEKVSAFGLDLHGSSLR
jgi:predicted aconitase with swiveling domain